MKSDYDSRVELPRDFHFPLPLLSPPPGRIQVFLRHADHDVASLPCAACLTTCSTMTDYEVGGTLVNVWLLLYYCIP